MRVLLVGDWPPPYGGLSVHVQQLQGYLSGQGIEARVLDIGKGGHVAPGVEPVRTPGQLLQRLRGFVEAGWLVHLHTSGNNRKSWLLAAAVGAPWPAGPRLITLHSGLLPEWVGGLAARRVGARVALAGYGRVVAVSEPVRAALARCGVPAERLRVCPAWLGSQVRPGPVPERVVQARARHWPLLAMAHHPSPVYGRRLMFRALWRLAEEWPAVGLAVFGQGMGSEPFWREAREEGVEGRVEDCGELGHPEALGLLGSCDVFVRPTTHDGDSLSVREALALGVPCVASDVCARPEGTYVFRSGQVEELVAKVREALAGRRARGAVADSGPVLLALYRELQAGWRGVEADAAR